MRKEGDPLEVSLQYSRDNKTWQDFTVGQTIIGLDNVGDKVYFRAGSEGNTDFAQYSDDYNCFVMSGKIIASGNIMSLLKQNFKDFKKISNSYCFSNLFNSCYSLTDASNLVLPATTLYDNCYEYMFFNCASLLVAPKLPATTLVVACYTSMFELCTSLKTAPELPATELVNSCYNNMFTDCYSLSSIKAAFQDWKNRSSTVSWLEGVASSGKFICPKELPIIRGENYIPEGWDVETF